MRTTQILTLSAFLFCASCTAINVKVDKTQAIYEDDETLVVPSSAVTPQINAEVVNAKVDELIVNATK